VDLAIAVTVGEGVDDFGSAGDGVVGLRGVSELGLICGGGADGWEARRKASDEGEVRVMENLARGIAGARWICGGELGDAVTEGGDFPNATDEGVPLAVFDLVAIEEAEVGAVDEELICLAEVFFFEEMV